MSKRPVAAPLQNKKMRSPLTGKNEASRPISKASPKNSPKTALIPLAKSPAKRVSEGAKKTAPKAVGGLNPDRPLRVKNQPQNQPQNQPTNGTEPFDSLRFVQMAGNFWQDLTKQYLPHLSADSSPAVVGNPTPDAPVFGTSISPLSSAQFTAWQQQWQGLSSELFPAALTTKAQFDYAAAKELPEKFAHEMKQLWDDFFLQKKIPQISDRRFSHPAWQESPEASLSAAQYLLSARYFKELAQLFSADAEGEKVRFNTEQWLEMMSPANFLASNPEALQTLIETKGESLTAGIKNLLADLSKGRISLTDESQFKVGQNLATTEGSVVYENDLIQLIQYAPKTAKVHSLPLLMVPPCINKFYILDLQPHNSLVRYLVDNGMTVFLVSWRNPSPELAHLSWDDYIDHGVLRAIVEASEITKNMTGKPFINALGFCVGGTLLTCALGVLAQQRRQSPIKALTLLTTLLDFSDTGVLGLFVNEEMVKRRELEIGGAGNTPPKLLEGRELAMTFSMLRPNDLIWSYVVNSYLKGQSPMPMDLLFWNGDSSNLPGRMYCEYLRHTYLQNELRTKGSFTVLGDAVNVAGIPTDNFVYGSREDHIVPWTAAYQSQTLLSGPTEFVLGASGHIAGVINPASKNKRSHWINRTANPKKLSAKEWFDGAEEIEGSWWAHWLAWLQARSGPLIKAVKKVGDATHPAIEPAPGRYVVEQAHIKI